MATIKPQQNQNMLDLALQEYGSIEGVFQFMDDNKLDRPDHKISVYDEFQIISDPSRREILEFYKSRAVIPATGFSESDLQLIRKIEKDCGIGCMQIENDFIVAPAEETILYGTIYKASNFNATDFKTFAEALVYGVYTDDNTIIDVKKLDLENISNLTIDFRIQVDLKKQYQIKVDYDAIRPLFPNFELEIVLTDSNNVLNLSRLIPAVEKGFEFTIKMARGNQPK